MAWMNEFTSNTKGGFVKLALNVYLFCIVSFFLLLNPAHANSDGARAHELFKSVRCMTCQGQSINDSEAHLAQVMRDHIRDEINHGKSDEEILTFIADRYGSEAILKTNFNSETIWLWCVPFLLFGYLSLQLRKKF